MVDKTETGMVTMIVTFLIIMIAGDIREAFNKFLLTFPEQC